MTTMNFRSCPFDGSRPPSIKVYQAAVLRCREENCAGHNFATTSYGWRTGMESVPGTAQGMSADRCPEHGHISPSDDMCRECRV